MLIKVDCQRFDNSLEHRRMDQLTFILSPNVLSHLHEPRVKTYAAADDAKGILPNTTRCSNSNDKSRHFGDPRKP